MKTFEGNIIGCLLIDEEDFAISKVSDKLTAEMFETEIAAKIFLEYQRAYDNHEKIDSIIVRQHLIDDGYDKVIVDAEINQALSGKATSAFVEKYAGELVKRYKAIQLHGIIEKVKCKPSEIENELASLISSVEALINNESVNNQTLPEIVQKYKGLYFVEHPPRMNLGFKKLDEVIGGFEKGDLIVIGARPAVGKSAFVTQFVCRLGKEGKKIGFYNLEMSDRQMYERFVVNESGLSLSYLKNSETYTVEEKKRFDAANEVLMKQSNIRIIDDGGKTVEQIRSESRHMGYDLIVVDYLQLLSPAKTYKGNRQAEVGEISRALKNLAKELNIPIIALSQLNRLSETAANKEPTMSELREAGNIEQDASVIILLWNLDAEDYNRKGCKVEKNRQGKLGRVVLNFNGDLMRFEETDEDFKDIKKHKKSPFKESKDKPVEDGNDFVPTEETPFD